VALVLGIRVGESIKVGQIKITYYEKDGNTLRLKFDGPRDVPIQRLDHAGVPVKFKREQKLDK